MMNLKTFAAWLVMVLLTAGVTVVGMRVLEKHWNVQQAVARFGR